MICIGMQNKQHWGPSEGRYMSRAMFVDARRIPRMYLHLLPSSFMHHFFWIDLVALGGS